MNAKGISDTQNEMTAYTIVQADHTKLPLNYLPVIRIL